MAELMKDGLVSLRALETEDLDIIYEWENDADLWKHGTTTAPFSRRLILEYLRNYSADIYAQRQLRLMVCLEADGTRVGMVDLFDFDPTHRRASVGLMVDRRYQNRGIGARALALMADYARTVLQMHQLSAQVAVDNGKSIRLFRRSGYEECGTLKDWLCTPDGYVDVAQLQLIF